MLDIPELLDYNGLILLGKQTLLGSNTHGFLTTSA